MWLYLGLLPSQELLPSQQALAHGHVQMHVMVHLMGSTHDVGDLPGPLVADEPGNEDGYVVKMTDDDLSPPYEIAPGTRVRLESLYEGDNRLLVRPAAHQPATWFVMAEMLDMARNAARAYACRRSMCNAQAKKMLLCLTV